MLTASPEPQPTSPAHLAFDAVCVRLGGQDIVRTVSFDLSAGEIGCLLGPSGCGKTTILRAIAGLERIDAGSIQLGGEELCSASRHVPTELRGVGMVFQDLALFPHLDITANIGFSLAAQPRNARKARVEQLLRLIDLPNAGKRFPHELSGGQQQRVALARAIANRPALLLMDEPFSGQDAERREMLARDVRDLLKLEGITALVVTHDQLEAFAIADTIGVMNAGQIAQWDVAYTLYHEPADRFVANFIGEGVLLCGSVMNAHALMTELGEIPLQTPSPFEVNTPIELLVRPDDVVLDERSAYTGDVVERKFRGSEHLYTVRLPGSTRVLCAAPSHLDRRVGEQIGVRLALDHLVVFRRDATLEAPV
ncbi:MAG: ABC transporter ATP-binding protein [Pseudomonadota bacterium]